MIPISSSTTLTLEKAAKLLQSLVDLRDNTHVDLPEEISKRVDRILKAQQKLTKDIDGYFRKESTYTDEDNLEMITTIVETCPEFLATRTLDNYNRLPCHYAAEEATTFVHKYLFLFARIGHQYQIGGKSKRGGLLVKYDGGSNALHYVKHPKVFNVLKSHDPPLFYAEDVQKYILQHYATCCHNIDLVKYFCDLDPSCLYQFARRNVLPIHTALLRRGDKDEKGEIVQYLIQKNVSYCGSDETIGGLFTTYPFSNSTLVLNKMVELCGKEEA